MIRKEEDQETDQRIKYMKDANKKHRNSRHPREIFVDELTKHLELINSNRENDLRKKSLLESMCSIPSMNLRDEKSLRSNESKAYIDDKLDLVTEVFPNGNEFE
ncbi:MAG: hypothetical protein ABL857_08775 [Rickettsiales bacterium]